MNAKDKAKQKEYRSKLNDLDIEARDKQDEHMKNYREGYGSKSELDEELKALHENIKKKKNSATRSILWFRASKFRPLVL